MKTDPGNLQTTYTYDEVGRLTAVHRPKGNNQYYDYDRNGNRTYGRAGKLSIPAKP